MSFSEFLNHKCNIYHITKKSESPGYSLKPSATFSYSDTPDIENIQCHFGVKNGTVNIIQMEPQANYEAKIKLSLPPKTDIRLNDKVVDLDTGYEYTAEIPRDVHGHHIVVWLHRNGKQVAL